jgi:hypothetical protein
VFPDHGHLLVGRSVGPLRVRRGVVAGGTTVALRPAQLTDPPILITLPLLAIEQAARDRLVE